MDGRTAFEMNPYDGYQLYQVQRTKTRVEILADDARRGRQAAAIFRGSRTLASNASRPGVMALNAIRAWRLRSRPTPYDGDRTGSPASRSLAWRGTRDRLHQRA